jgi:hypothetical protein
MARRIGQVAASVPPYTHTLMQRINYDVKKIIDIGIQMPVGSYININGKDFEIGKTGVLQFEDVEITSLMPKWADSSIDDLIYVIIDCVYENEE